ncbi:MAG: folate-binding protein YgfZ [Alphaproteobacteria bacterium]|nr:folate-binding protein YgfZ [Alphaproteobacteria bacterium]MCA0449951.1 folate-binding protein [Pseudomonadota bacterium]
MTAPVFAILPSRAVLAVSGEDRKTFLQGLISADTLKLTPSRAGYGGFLTAQGRFLHEFALAEAGETILLDVEAARIDDLAKRLKLYKLRAKVTIDPRPDLEIAIAWGENVAAKFGLDGAPGSAKTEGEGAIFVDPRLAELGVRAILPKGRIGDIATTAGLAMGDAGDYDALRVKLGVPDGSRDLEIDRALLLENGFDELAGVDWKKGCYIGQELTARMKYRGLVKKRLVPVAIDGPIPAPGTIVKLGEAEAGEMRSSAGAMGLALLRLEAMEKAAAEGTPLQAGDATLTPHKPAWANF